MLTDEQRRVLTEAAQIFTGTDRRRAVLNELAASAAPAEESDAALYRLMTQLAADKGFTSISEAIERAAPAEGREAAEPKPGPNIEWFRLVARVRDEIQNWAGADSSRTAKATQRVMRKIEDFLDAGGMSPDAFDRAASITAMTAANAEAVDERAAFETWVKHRGGDVMKRDGDYVSSMTREWWACWQARAALATASTISEAERGTYDKDAAIRLRAIVNLLGVPAPNDDETMMGALFAVLGNVRHAIGLATDAAQDKQRLDWLMRQVCCDEIDGISIEFGLSQDDHYAEFRRQIDAQIARIDPPFGDVGRIDRAGTKGEKS